MFSIQKYDRMVSKYLRKSKEVLFFLLTDTCNSLKKTRKSIWLQKISNKKTEEYYGY